MAQNKAYTPQGDLGAELRSTVDISPGGVLFAFACENEDDDESLPAIVQVAMIALSGRTFQQLTSTCTAKDGEPTKYCPSWRERIRIPI
jgi:hypothetical protein